VNSKGVVYALIDPRDNQVRYIGSSVELEKRIRQHILDSRRADHEGYSACKKWIYSVLQAGYQPIVNIVEITIQESLKDAEEYWIETFLKSGYLLMNSKGSKGHPRTYTDGLTLQDYSARNYAKLAEAWSIRADAGKSRRKPAEGEETG
jgi:hypothetical protein